MKYTIRNMSSTPIKVYPMNETTMQQKGHQSRSHHSRETPLAVVSDHTTPLARDEPKMPYDLGTDEPWPDQGLNRILATVDNFNRNELNEVECLEMLFYLSSRRQDARDIAEAALETYGSLAKVFQRPGKELRELLGMDHAMTALLAIAKSSMKFILTPNLSERRELKSYAALMNYLALDLREAEQEILRIIYLDAKCRIIRDEEMARGTVDSVSIYPKEIAKRATTFCASSIILAHNHLGDDPTPSQEDVEATVRTKGALQLFDIALHDHVIIARSRCLSMQQQRMI